jgi:hypothetical protein
MAFDREMDDAFNGRAPDLRESLDPAWAALKEARDSLVWDIRWEERWGADVPRAEERLLEWESRHADEWNRLKPWYAPRLKGRTRD